MEAPIMGWITLASVAVNAIVAVVGPWFAKRLVDRQAQLDAAKRTLTTVASGLRIVEAAVAQNKSKLDQTAAGNQITRTITNYGPAATAIVDVARTTIHTLDVLTDAERSAYEQRMIAAARAEHEARLKQYQAAQ